MKKFFIILAAPIVLLLVSCSHAQEKTSFLSKANDESGYTWDFGQVHKDEILKHTFILTNDSNVTLTINNVQATCGCTTSEVKKKILLAGESTELEVKLKTKGYVGEVKQYIFVYTDSLDNPILRFIIKAYVK